MIYLVYILDSIYSSRDKLNGIDNVAFYSVRKCLDNTRSDYPEDGYV